MIDKILSSDQAWLIAWNNFANSSHFWLVFSKLIAEYLIYLVPVILIVLWFWPVSPSASRGGPRESKKAALKAVLAGGVGLSIAKVIGPIINRPRPFEGGSIHEILFHRPDYSFPSDHAILLFALTFSFWLSGYKKLAIVMFGLSLFISAARIAVGVHFPSDIISGGILGIFIAWIIHLLDRPLQIVYNFLIKIATSIRLA